MSKIKDSTFIIVANGYADGPAQALQEYLIRNKAKDLIVINHPLVPEGKGWHIIKEYKSGKLIKEKKLSLPNKPPYTFLFDPLVPLRLPYTDVWIGFNNLVSLKGLSRRKRGKVNKVVHWAVDFVPERFGSGVATKVYNKVDTVVAKGVDLRVELSETGLVERDKYLGLAQVKKASVVVAPMGAWLDRTPKATAKNWNNKKVVYLGHLVERQGVATLIEAISILDDKVKGVTAEVIGSGPLLGELKALSKKLGLGSKVTFHGFVKDHKDVEKILASGTVASAPYVKDEASFTQYADPGKLKAYLGSGLPIVLTDVPPNAHELMMAGVARVVEDSPEALAKGLEEYLNDKDLWQKSHSKALIYAKQFDWNYILENTLNEIDLH